MVLEVAGGVSKLAASFEQHDQLHLSLGQAQLPVRVGNEKGFERCHWGGGTSCSSSSSNVMISSVVAMSIAMDASYNE